MCPFGETREQVFLGRRPHKEPNGRFVDDLNRLNAVSEEVLTPRKVYRNAVINRLYLFYYTLAKDFLNFLDPLKPNWYPEFQPLNVPGGDKNLAVTGDVTEEGGQLGLF